jgi:hypothetical protein
VIGQNVAGFANDLNWRPPAQHLVAIKVFGHQRQILRIFVPQRQQTVLFFGTHSGLVSDILQINLLSRWSFPCIYD